MKIIHMLHVTIARWFYGWALSEIDPLHKDVGKIVRRKRELDDKAARFWA